MLIQGNGQLSFERSSASRKGFSLSNVDSFERKAADCIPSNLLRDKPAEMPEMAEPEVVRHFVNLSKKNFSIDTHFYPLGSCSMKYNPKINEWVSALDGFANIHPLQPAESVQGFLKVFSELKQMLKEITGMDGFTLQPAAGAHGELTGMMIVHAYHRDKGEHQRRKVLVPDAAHGTNPATAALLGYEVIEVKSNSRGRVDIEDLKLKLDDEVACLMLTNPNTLGLFEEDILEIRDLVHEKGGLLYYDGANLNALLGIARPGDMGFDIIHLNLHKTFSTPHGGGGPGSGPVGVKEALLPYLPSPGVIQKDDGFALSGVNERSVGRVKSFMGNAGMILRAYVYILTYGQENLRSVSEDAILNANYIKEGLKGFFDVQVDEACMHEFVITLKGLKESGIHAGDVGKRLLDYGIHAPTVSFPLVVEEALMIEPTETESKETLDNFIEVMRKIAEECKQSPDLVKNAPYSLPIKRPDEVKAARTPILSFKDFKALNPSEIPQASAAQG